MSNPVVKEKTVSTRVTSEISQRAKENLAKQGLTLSEYIRLSLIKAANNEVQLINFLETPEAIAAKQEAESNQLEEIGSIKDFEKWIDDIK